MHRATWSRAGTGCMTPWRDDVAHVEAILGALTLAPHAISIGARTLAVAPGQRDAVLARLLYEECFIKGLDEAEPPRAVDADAAAFVAELSARNAGTGRIASGWHVATEERTGHLIVVKDGRRFRVAPELVHRNGENVEIRAPKEDATSSDVFYFAYGDALPLGEAPVPRTRYYVNVASGGAAALVGALTRRLNAERVQFSLKCFRDPHDYYRRDGVVVYVDSARNSACATIVAAAARDVRPFVRTATPILTHRVGRGIAFAPEPGGESYGQRCCRILARAILTAGARVCSAGGRGGHASRAPHRRRRPRRGTPAQNALGGRPGGDVSIRSNVSGVAAGAGFGRCGRAGRCAGVARGRRVARCPGVTRGSGPGVVRYGRGSMMITGRG